MLNRKTMKYTLHICLLIAIAYSVLIEPSPFVRLNGQFLEHTNYGYLILKNAGAGSFFMTSDQGQGYQAELPRFSTFLSELGPKPGSLVECQQPWGYPVSCGMCRDASGRRSMNNVVCTRGTFSARFGFGTPIGPLSQLVKQDTLNELGSRQSPNYVFLDTIVNNTNQSFSMATTTAPLYQQMVNPDGSVVSSPGTIVNALDSGDLFFMNSIFSLVDREKPHITVGGNEYPIQFLSTNTRTNSDLRYSLFGKNEHNPRVNQLSTKRHMALPTLALSSQGTSGTQTIILFPTDPFSSCQPVIFIGRDISTNAFYVLTYLTRHIDPETNLACCQSEGGLCDHDTLYCSSMLSQNGGCAIFAANTDGSILMGTGPGSQARLKVVLDPMPDSPQFAYASSIEALPGLWWPEQPDFVEQPEAKPGAIPQQATTQIKVANKTMARIVKKG